MVKRNNKAEKNPNWKGGKIKANCTYCNKEQLIHKCRTITFKFCSISCRNKFLFKGKQKEHPKGCKCPFCNQDQYVLQNNKHPNWKGNNVSYKGLHKWLRDHIPKKELCEQCKTLKSYDISNKTGIYDRNFINYWWLCRSCHKKYDFIEKKERRALNGQFKKRGVKDV